METDIFGALHGVQNNKTKIRLRAPPDVETFTGHCHQYHSNLQRLGTIRHRSIQAWFSLSLSHSRSTSAILSGLLPTKQTGISSPGLPGMKPA